MRRAARHGSETAAVPWVGVSAFFIDTSTGQIATLNQLVAAGVTAADDAAAAWHPVRGDRDASTLWYAVMRKETRGVFIGTLCIRHSDHHASLLQRGWQEVRRRTTTAGPGVAVDLDGRAHLGDVDRRADRDFVVELLDVRHVHADAAV